MLIGKFVLWIGGIVSAATIAFISKNSIADIVQFVKASKFNKKVIQHGIDMVKIEELGQELALHYGAERCLVYGLHNQKTLLNGLCMKFFSCMYEYHIKELSPKKNFQQNLPISAFIQLLLHYEEKGTIICDDRENCKVEIPDFNKIMELENVQSTYSMIFQDKKKKNICVVVLNGELNKLKITNLDEFYYKGRQIGELLTNE